MRTTTDSNATRRVAGRRVEPVTRISSPGRVVYPELGITKQQVAAYYRAVASKLLPELVDRPLSVVRCPGGIDECF
ncbi:MAG: DNA polymerase domain-containing protein, partial [Luteimonas sp.]